MPLTGSLVARHVAFDDIQRADWDLLVSVTQAATPFARWTFHRAWWDAYGSTAHDEYLVITEPGSDEVRGIVPLMHRHEQEPGDEPTHTMVREHSPRCAPVAGEARAVMFGASYHADYATVLAADSDLEAVAQAAASALVLRQEQVDDEHAWDVVDLRRLREVDPALPALEAAFRSALESRDWRITRDEEDVCPVVTVRGDTWDEFLATLDKTARHEIRRKLRRAAAVGELTIEITPPTPEAIDDFIRLHNLRFGDGGLFPDNEGGARSLRFVQRLAELESGDANRLMHVARVRCGRRLVFVVVAFDDGNTCFMYNGGMDPEALNVSPGVTGAALYLMDRIAAGRRRFDYLRGQERYKYEWGAVDEPIYRLLVDRGAAA